MPIEINSFQKELKRELETFQTKQLNKFPKDELLKIDLHCHDHNSDVPDELLGRILNLPETWLETDRLIKTLISNRCDTFTITNHNNARSCYELLDKGFDIITSAEFTCTIPDYGVSIHVLTYGFTPKQEKKLNKLRKNLYEFLAYCKVKGLPTIWAHPLYFYSKNGIPPMDFFNKMSLLFERFEAFNGQRDTWQNLLVKFWIESLTKSDLEKYADKFDIDPYKFCDNPFQKSLSGGSDSHMGIFSGLTGTYLHVPDLEKKLETIPRSELALQAIKEGKMIPYGSHHNSEKLTIAFLDYVCQIALNRKDPGMLRIMLHRGSTQQKLLALFISNAFAEIQRHKVTKRFIKLFHDSFIGETPSFSKKLLVPKIYKPIFKDAVKIAKSKKENNENLVELYSGSLKSIGNQLNEILFERLTGKIKNIDFDKDFNLSSLNEIIAKMEFPSEFRTYFEKDTKLKKRYGKKMTKLNLAGFLDGLSFPFLASMLVLAANFTSARVMYNSRPLLEKFSEKIGKLKHPKRMLWLTDTFEDNNGVTMVLKAMHQEAKARNLPIDFLVCSNTIEPDDHLIVIKPLSEITLPFYKQQPLRFPNYLFIHEIFLKGGYDRIMCSTEGLMGLAAIYLKNAYSVKTHFFIHTDWLMFAQKVLNLDLQNLERIRRILRAFYRNFDNLFVLNKDHRKWLSSRNMGFRKDNIKLTAHWVDEEFIPREFPNKGILGLKNDDKVILFTGRVSKEKGIMELPKIYAKVLEYNSDIKFVIAGTGPDEKELKKLMPNAIFLGWVEHNQLPNIYSASDILVLPSKFDTFSCVVLEALSCGLPVISYKTKGPKDIILDEKCGYLVNKTSEISEKIIEYFSDIEIQKKFKKSAIERSKKYTKENIVAQLLYDIELG